jgi:hypothetical protein
MYGTGKHHSSIQDTKTIEMTKAVSDATLLKK